MMMTTRIRTVYTNMRILGLLFCLQLFNIFEIQTFVINNISYNFLVISGGLQSGNNGNSGSQSGNSGKSVSQNGNNIISGPQSGNSVSQNGNNFNSGSQSGNNQSKHYSSP